MNFSENLKYYREGAKKSRKEMADQLGITPTAYGAYELGKRTPTIDIMIKIATILQVSIDTLLGFSPQNEENTNELEEAKKFLVSGGYKVTPIKIRKLLDPRSRYTLGYQVEDTKNADSYLYDIEGDTDLISLVNAIKQRSDYKDGIRTAKSIAIERELFNYMAKKHGWQSHNIDNSDNKK